jgi:seryl-tRNA synthetase
MLDLHFIRENLDLVRQNCRNRGVEVDLDALVRLDEARRALIAEQQAVQEQRNKLARDMKGRKPSDAERALGKDLKERDAALEEELERTRVELAAVHNTVPNLTHPAAPIGKTDEDNRELRVFRGKPSFGFKPLDHVDLAAKHDLIDFESAAKVTGQKFYYLKNEMVLIEQALIRFSLDSCAARATRCSDAGPRAPGRRRPRLQPARRRDQHLLDREHGPVLVGTAEITLGGLHQNEILDAATLPRALLRPVALLPGRGRRARRASRGSTACTSSAR